MTHPATSITPKFDRASMLKTMRFAFARNDTVIKELLQNGRRAGATLIDVTYDGVAQLLHIKDNGCGLDDLGKLIEFCESGWDQATKDAEGPFGVGFLSALYAGKIVRFASKGRAVRMETSRLLETSDSDPCFEIEASDVVVGAEVTLEGFSWPNAERRISEMARGFAVAVTFNGREVERPDADGAAFEDSAVGRVRFLHPIPKATTESSVRIYLQGFVVGDPARHPQAVIHLDSCQFIGKFPDRDTVIEHKSMQDKVTAELAECVKRKLLAARDTTDPLTFLLNHLDQAASVGMLDVFNDIDVLPAQWFMRLDGIPFDEYEEKCGNLTVPVADRDSIRRSDLENGSFTVAVLDQFSAGDDPTTAQWNLAAAARAAVFVKELDIEHWVYRLAAIRSDDSVEHVMEGTRNAEAQDFSGSWSSARLLPCASLKLTNGRITATASQLVFDGSSVLIPDGVDPLDEEILKQISSYRDEWGEEQENDLSADAQKYCEAAIAVGEPDAAKRLVIMVQQAIAGIRSERKGTKLTVEVGEDGRLVALA